MLTRRDLLRTLGLLGVAMPLVPGLAPRPAWAAAGRPIMKSIPSSGESLPVIGMGTSRTFDAQLDAATREQLGEVLETFFAAGGTLIDSSPMYGAAESVVGELLDAIGHQGPLFAATKVWTDGREQGIAQMEASARKMGVTRLDLIQIHNLRDWKTHVATLKAWKDEGRVRYIGVTTSHGRDHAELETAMKAEPFDFVQLSYNIIDREVEQRLLPLAVERGMAVLVNRPFRRGDLFARVKGRAVPEWAGEFGCATWGQFFLKHAVSHPAVTCAIPATSKPHHMKDNMGAIMGRLPDAKERARMEAFIAEL